MEISRDGHRARMRAAYLQGGGDAMPDHQLLELLLSISIPRKDVKPIAYALINRFGSLEQVFAAGAADLQQVPGVGRTDRRTDSAGTGSETGGSIKIKTNRSST